MRPGRLMLPASVTRHAVLPTASRVPPGDIRGSANGPALQIRTTKDRPVVPFTIVQRIGNNPL